jgi:hypothetical protein
VEGLLGMGLFVPKLFVPRLFVPRLFPGQHPDVREAGILLAA